MSDFDRNLVGFVGSFGGGKTFGLNAAKRVLDKLGVPYEPAVISDGQNIVTAILSDDAATNGRKHIHPTSDISDRDLLAMCTENDLYGHTHGTGQVDLGFAVTDYGIPFEMYRSFTYSLSQARNPKKIVLFEWSGGRNGYPDGHPIARADYSYEQMVREFESGNYYPFFDNVLGILHPMVPGDFEGRQALNERRKVHRPTQREIDDGTASWWIPRPGMLLTVEDDFDSMEEYIKTFGPQDNIYTLDNDGGDRYLQGIEGALMNVFQPWLDAEGRFRGFNDENSDRGMARRR